MTKKNARTRELEHLIRNWERYRDMVVPALGAASTSERQEKKFLQLKAELAAQIQWLEETLPRSMTYESHQGAEVMADLMRRHVTLCTYDMDQRWDPQDFQNTWHQYFIYLNRLRGARMQEQSAGAGAVQDPGARASRTGNAFGWILTWGFGALVVFLLATAAGLRISRSGISFRAPESFSQVTSNLGEVFATLWAGPSQLLEPVTTAYGAQWGFALIGLLVLASGAFFIARQN